MASGGGPRAAGTDGKDHKFRQRVDDHYRVMASAKKSIRTAARLQLARLVADGLPGRLDDAGEGEAGEQRRLRADRVRVLRVEVQLLLLNLWARAAGRRGQQAGSANAARWHGRGSGARARRRGPAGC